MLAHSPRSSVPAPFQWLSLLLLWIALWTFLFSALDFWTIKLFDICNWPIFESYRSIMRYGVSWVSPPSFALAENVYFFWVNGFDQERTMHEWEFYSGQPFNPDGDYNFVWGDNHGGWMRFPMSIWYSGWLVPSILWLLGLLIIAGRRQLILPGQWAFGRVLHLLL